MKTVRLSQDLKWTIGSNARQKYTVANPQKPYPDHGYVLLKERELVTKTERTATMFKAIWGTDMPTTTARSVVIRSVFSKEPDEDGYVETYNKNYTFEIPETEVPDFVCRYDIINLEVEPDHPTFVECISVENYNQALNVKQSQQRISLESVLERFSTLNQLLKAAPYLKDLVPADKISKMHEVDDRSGRRKELAELADGELQGMRETLLESSLLGDD